MTRFRVGVNYWPRSSAMYMWQRFDAAEIREDMARIRALGFDIVRFFLTWEAFAPERDRIDDRALKNFDAIVAAIHDANLSAMPTLFCGHMSGVNWIPGWALDESTPHGRFRTMAGGAFSPYGIGDFYRDDALIAAQVLLARSVGARAAGNPSIYAWDLGNEFSNMREPATPMDAASWSTLLTEELLEVSGAGTTAGIHGEDLERDRRIRPSMLAEPLLVATMHGYPVYSVFSRGRLDVEVVPFLCALVQSFTRKPVLFSEFGNPACASHVGDSKNFAGASPAATQKVIECLDEDEMANYAENVLARLLAGGAIGAMWWCWADYDPSLASLPPFDRAPHEMRFGLVRADGSEKPVAKVLSRFAREAHSVREPPPPFVGETDYYASLPQGVFDLYHDYCRTHD